MYIEEFIIDFGEESDESSGRKQQFRISSDGE